MRGAGADLAKLGFGKAKIDVAKIREHADINLPKPFVKPRLDREYETQVRGVRINAVCPYFKFDFDVFESLHERAK